MLDAIETTAEETKARVLKILAAMEKAKKLVQTEAPKIYSKDLIDLIFKHPYCKIQFIEKAGIAKRQTASRYLKTLEELGILQGVKKGLEIYYINKNLVKIMKE